MIVKLNTNKFQKFKGVIELSQDEMRIAISEAIENSGYQVSYIASQINTSPSNLSNILNPKRNIPLSLLQSLMLFLEDKEFTAKAIEFFSNEKIMPDNITKIPAMQFLAAEKEEQERKEYEGTRFKEIISKPVECWTENDIDFLTRYDKELYEEVISENGYHWMLSGILKKLKEKTHDNHNGYDRITNNNFYSI